MPDTTKLSPKEQIEYKAAVDFVSNNRMVAENILSFFMATNSHIAILKDSLAQAVIRPCVESMNEGALKGGFEEFLNGLASKRQQAGNYLYSPLMKDMTKEAFLDGVLSKQPENAEKKHLKNIIKLKNRVILTYALFALITTIAVGSVIAGSLGLAGLPVASGCIAAGTFAASKASLVTGAVATHKAAAIATASVSGATYLASKMGIFKNIRGRIPLNKEPSSPQSQDDISTLSV